MNLYLGAWVQTRGSAPSRAEILYLSVAHFRELSLGKHADKGLNFSAAQSRILLGNKNYRMLRSSCSHSPPSPAPCILQRRQSHEQVAGRRGEVVEDLRVFEGKDYSKSLGKASSCA